MTQIATTVRELNRVASPECHECGGPIMYAYWTHIAASAVGLCTCDYYPEDCECGTVLHITLSCAKQHKRLLSPYQVEPYEREEDA